MKMRDAIHGMVNLSPEEMEIINTPAFQRLRYIRQLATTYLVYSGAEHTRFGHSIGVMHVASRVIQNLRQKRPDCFYALPEEQKAHWEWMEQMLRLMALTHDLGHPPFSHAGEDLLPKRKKHEDYTRDIILNTGICEIIDRIGVLFCEKNRTDKFQITAKLVVDTYLGVGMPSNDRHLLNFLMDSEMDCDKMDYLLRDSHYCGVNYGHYDLERLLSAIDIAPSVEDESVKVIALQEDGLHAFEEFVLARYFMFLQVYFHKTRRILDMTLQRYLKRALPGGHYPEDVGEYLKWNDNRVLQNMENCREMKEATHFLERSFTRLVLQTSAHEKTAERERCLRIKRALVERNICAMEDIIEDDASKLPHNIPSLGFGDEKAVYLLKEDGRTTNIITESYVLNQIRESIKIHRLYVTLEKKDAARDYIRAISI